MEAPLKQNRGTFDKKYGKWTSQNLSPNRPVGHIIDIIYWIEPKGERCDPGS